MKEYHLVLTAKERFLLYLTIEKSKGDYAEPDPRAAILVQLRDKVMFPEMAIEKN